MTKNNQEQRDFNLFFSEVLPGASAKSPEITTVPLSESKLDWSKQNYQFNYTNSAIKFDSDKLPVNLLSSEALLQTAAVLKFGAKKYAEHNWRKGFLWSRPLAAAMRHLLAFNAGQDRDPESNLSHLAHAMCCIMFLLEFEKTHPELDDRYKDVLTTKNTSK